MTVDNFTFLLGQVLPMVKSTKNIVLLIIDGALFMYEQFVSSMQLVRSNISQVTSLSVHCHAKRHEGEKNAISA